MAKKLFKGNSMRAYPIRSNVEDYIAITLGPKYEMITAAKDELKVNGNVVGVNSSPVFGIFTEKNKNIMMNAKTGIIPTIEIIREIFTDDYELATEATIGLKILERIQKDVILELKSARIKL